MHVTLVPHKENNVDVTSTVGRTDVYHPTVDTPSGVSRPPVPAKRVVEFVAEDRVIFNTDSMDPGRPYPYKLGGEWLIAVLRLDGKIDFYSFK
jgi:hypothetical protein